MTRRAAADGRPPAPPATRRAAARRSRPPAITPGRAARLYHLLSLTAAGGRTRAVLLKKLKVDLRGFYRDVGFLRDMAIELTCEGDRYRLAGDLDAALDRLPFPDPGLSLRDAMLLAEGRTAAHRKLKTRIGNFIGPNGHAPT